MVMLMMQSAGVTPDVFEIIALGILLDGLLTLINLCVLGLTLKLYSEFYKVRALSGDESKLRGKK